MDYNYRLWKKDKTLRCDQCQKVIPKNSLHVECNFIADEESGWTSGGIYWGRKTYCKKCGTPMILSYEDELKAYVGREMKLVDSYKIRLKVKKV